MISSALITNLTLNLTQDSGSAVPPSVPRRIAIGLGDLDGGTVELRESGSIGDHGFAHAVGHWGRRKPAPPASPAPRGAWLPADSTRSGFDRARHLGGAARDARRRRRSRRRRLVGDVLDGRGGGFHRQVDGHFRRRHFHRRTLHFWRRRRRRLARRPSLLRRCRPRWAEPALRRPCARGQKPAPMRHQNVQANDRCGNDAAAGEETRILYVSGHVFPWSRVKTYRRVKTGWRKVTKLSHQCNRSFVPSPGLLPTFASMAMSIIRLTFLASAPVQSRRTVPAAAKPDNNCVCDRLGITRIGECAHSLSIRHCAERCA